MNKSIVKEIEDQIRSMIMNWKEREGKEGKGRERRRKEGREGRKENPIRGYRKEGYEIPIMGYGKEGYEIPIMDIDNRSIVKKLRIVL